MRARMARARRRPPPPRRAGPQPEGERPRGDEGGRPAAPREGGEPGEPPRGRRAGEGSRPERLAADLPPANLAIRVRRPLDERLGALIHGLRQEGVRTSKVELVEMLLWELPDDDLEGARARLARFRRWAPRGPGAPLEEAGPGGER